MAKFGAKGLSAVTRALPSAQIKDVGIGLGLIALSALAIWFLVRKKGKGQHVTPPVDRTQWRQGFDPAFLATKLYNALAGWGFWTGPKGEVLTELNALNDDEFKAVYRQYNRDFTTPPESLRTVIENEWIWDTLWGEGVLGQLKERFNRLNLP